MKTIKNECGASLISLLFGLFIVVSVSSFTINVVPLFLENYTVKSSLNSLSDVPSSTIQNDEELRKLLMRRLSINNVSHVGQKDINIRQREDATEVKVEYEVRTSFLGNIDLVVSFNDSEELIR